MVQERKIVEEVSGWLRVFDDGSVDRTWLGPPEVKFLLEPVLAHEEFLNGVAVRDVAAGSGLKVRIYLPETEPEGGSVEKLPVLLHFHGGGFCISQADWYMYYTVYTALAKQARAIVISPFLHLAPENRLPAAVDDGYSALLWLRSLARSESHDPWLTDRADFKRVFLVGDSSGGNLVHHVAVQAGKTTLDPVRLSGAIPIHPGFCRSTRSQSELEMPQTPFLTLEMADKFLALALPLGATKDHPITCPMGTTAPPLTTVEMPPMMLVVAEKDLIRDPEMEYYEAMKEAGKTVELFVNKGMTHGFHLNEIAVDMDPHTRGETQRLYDGIVDFIKRH